MACILIFFWGVKMNKHKTAEQMAEIIADIYEKKFGGKRRGRFQILRSTFRQLAGRINLHDTFIQEVAVICLENGFVLFSLKDIIVVIETKVMLNYRNVPKSIFDFYLAEDEDNDEDNKQNKNEDEESE